MTEAMTFVLDSVSLFESVIYAAMVVAITCEFAIFIVRMITGNR